MLTKLTKKDLRNLPKVELHRHLDGSVRFETIVDLMKRNNLDLQVKDQDELFKKAKVLTPKRNLQEVLDSFTITQKVLCHYEAIKRVTFENVEDAYRDGVKLLELRFAVTFIALGKTLGNDEIIEGILDGLKEAKKKYNLPVGLIHILPRSLDRAANEAAAKDILKFKKSPHPLASALCGFDLADAEAGTHPPDFVALVEEARKGGLGITIHSGEETDHQAVERTIQLFSPSRIGHGIKSIESPDTVRLLKEKNVHLEICPTSNWLTQGVKTLEDHPFPRFYREGVSVSLNTDDPHIMGIDLVNEYEVAHRLFGMGPTDFYHINKDSLSRSFLDQDLKNFVQKKYFSSKSNR